MQSRLLWLCTDLHCASSRSTIEPAIPLWRDPVGVDSLRDRARARAVFAKADVWVTHQRDDQPMSTQQSATGSESTLDPSSNPADVFPVGEPRGQRRARHSRRARLYVWACLAVGAFAVLIALIAANTHAVKLDWVVGSTRASLVWVILAATVLGWLLGITTGILFRHRTRRPAGR